MFGLGVWELAIILVIIVLIFGANKLPQIGSGLGKGIQNFKKSVKDQESAPGIEDDQKQEGKAEERKDV